MKVKRMRGPITSLLFLTFIPALAFAQAGEGSWKNLQQLRVGQKIQVVEKGLKQHNGTFIGFSDESISLRVGNDQVGVRREDVLRVSNRQQSKRLQNALLGAVIGAGAGLGVSLVLLSKGDFLAGETLGMFVPIGAGGGAAIGAAIPGYQTIYRGQK